MPHCSSNSWLLCFPTSKCSSQYCSFSDIFVDHFLLTPKPNHWFPRRFIGPKLDLWWSSWTRYIFTAATHLVRFPKPLIKKASENFRAKAAMRRKAGGIVINCRERTCASWITRRNLIQRHPIRVYREQLSYEVHTVHFRFLFSPNALEMSSW